MRTKLVIQGEIEQLFKEQNNFLAPQEMRGYSVSVIIDKLPWMIHRALKNKSRQCQMGAVVVEVTREVLPKPEWAE